MSERRAQIQSAHKLSKARRCELLGLARSTAYYRPAPICEQDLELMRLIDEIHLRYPFYGSRRVRDELDERGHRVNRKRVQRLMRRMGLRALYPRRRTSQPGQGHKIYPYLLRGLTIERANQVWASDVSYIPMAKGFMYLVAIMDWHTRKVLSWRVSNTLEPDFCVEALEEALARYGAPEIFNTDQGAQFTCQAFTGVLRDHGVAISMDGKGRWLDNVFVERCNLCFGNGTQPVKLLIYLLRDPHLLRHGRCPLPGDTVATPRMSVRLLPLQVGVYLAVRPH